MQRGLDIVELAQRVQAQAAANRDFVIDTRQVRMNDDATLSIPSAEQIITGQLPITEHAHNSITFAQADTDGRLIIWHPITREKLYDGPARDLTK